MLQRRAVGAVLVAAGVLALVGVFTTPATADPLEQAFRRWGQTFVVTSVSDAALDVDQRGSGAIVNMSDGGTDEYTFDQSSATFLNQLNLSDDLKIGNGTPGVTLDGEDAYIEGTLEVDGAVTFDGAVTLATGDVGAGEIANVVRYINIPLQSFVDCQTDAGVAIGFGEAVDALPDIINSATDGTGMVIRFDDTGSSEDQGAEICSQVTVPADYASGGALVVRALKDAHTAGNTELLTCGASINGAALGVAATTAIGAAATASYTCTPAGTFAAGDSASLYLSITSGGTMDDTVDLASAAFSYTATQ